MLEGKYLCYLLILMRSELTLGKTFIPALLGVSPLVGGFNFILALALIVEDITKQEWKSIVITTTVLQALYEEHSSRDLSVGWNW